MRIYKKAPTKVKSGQNKKGQKIFQLHRFLNPFSQLPAVKEDSENGAAGKFFGPSYFVTALAFFNKCFVHPIFGFLSLLATKLQNYYIIFVNFFQGKTDEKQKENHATKVTKKPKTKNQKKKIWDERN